MDNETPQGMESCEDSVSNMDPLDISPQEIPINRPLSPIHGSICGYIDTLTCGEKVNSRLTFFLEHGAGLRGLRITVEEDEFPISINPNFLETLSLPNLETLEIHQYGCFSVSYNENLFFLINSIFRAAAQSLKSFEIRANFKIRVSSNSSISFNLPFIPPSLQQMTVNPEHMESAELEALLGNQSLPNLTRLKLLEEDSYRKLEDGTLSMILNNLKDSLKMFTIKDTDEDSDEEPQIHPRARSILRFPVMEKLEKLKICKDFIELEPGQAPLQRFIPNVNHLELTHQTEEILQRWMEGSEYPAVETLVVECIIADDLNDWNEICRGINSRVAGWIHTTFPNVTSLTVLVLPKETSGLKTIFERMTQLTSLHIQVRGTDEEDTDPLFMDSALTDLPSEVVSIFVENPGLQNGIEIKRGIGKLINLQSLYLEHMRDDFRVFGHRLSLNLTFSCVLRNLRKLKTVRLKDGQSSSWHVSIRSMRRRLTGRIRILKLE